MEGKGEMEIVDSAAHGAGPSNQSSTLETGALVEVTFQRDTCKKNKYLEAEPKALGITQIMLSLFSISIRCAGMQHEVTSHLALGSLALFGLIAGSVAIVAQNLHLPTLKACLGVQIVMCVMSVIFFIDSSRLLTINHIYSFCWVHFHNDSSEITTCQRIMDLYRHIMGVDMLVHVVQIALSATLAAFCCKVIQCCSPQTNVPVIAVNAPQAQ
ncbi:membrane-spanning 4-domains subfamily A member 4A-like [Brachyhypopomus gauderio]|uniref:membrane-spanning 4-domains subfamily A member 4A-like n=1 Tax=Brachyhypopomus gauderio TaxID=698409 RepID=UPI00404343F5